MCYANFYVKTLRKNNDQMTQFHWSRKSHDTVQPPECMLRPCQGEVQYLSLCSFLQSELPLSFKICLETLYLQ